ncbi:MAG: adenosylcobinamide amidohydrolase [Acidobacteria bacterium]|nr:adenosylcobinamide amidohydrolase [Acidobacteriota bacterium]MYJ03041.1 adenosylcobinamide amidohydrolase [Acidobacteriota bacterium]
MNPKTPEATAAIGDAADVLHGDGQFIARRSGRFLVVELLMPHRVVSTSAHQGGEQEDLRYLVNHQSCEASGDTARHELISRLGLPAYHRDVCGEIGIDPDRAAVMGTAANMACAAHRSAGFEELRADAFVTAGVAGNATRAGEPASWHETDDGSWRRVNPMAGTINTLLLINVPITSAAQARAVVTMTEAKSAALADLAVPSRRSPAIATGTGTDQFCIAAPLDPSRRSRESTGPHAKLGELIGVAVKEATAEALRWQNGLEPSYTRGLAHALGRFGFAEAEALERLAELLPESQHALLERNQRALFYDPGVAASAYAIAAVLDRIAAGTLPAGYAAEALRHQAASLACAVSARPLDWVSFHAALGDARDDSPVDLVLRAIAVGWAAKWT